MPLVVCRGRIKSLPLQEGGSPFFPGLTFSDYNNYLQIFFQKIFFPGLTFPDYNRCDTHSRNQSRSQVWNL